MLCLNRRSPECNWVYGQINYHDHRDSLRQWSRSRKTLSGQPHCQTSIWPNLQEEVESCEEKNAQTVLFPAHACLERATSISLNPNSKGWTVKKNHISLDSQCGVHLLFAFHHRGQNKTVEIWRHWDRPRKCERIASGLRINLQRGSIKRLNPKLYV